ncbi:hypothetical protein JHK86_012164 [Glycine max]|nr:hypothetical protein JHK86_012164 [Glycine max]
MALFFFCFLRETESKLSQAGSTICTDIYICVYIIFVMKKHFKEGLQMNIYIFLGTKTNV